MSIRKGKHIAESRAKVFLGLTFSGLLFWIVIGGCEGCELNKECMNIERGQPVETW